MDSQLKSLWTPRKTKAVTFLCPLCKTQRKLPHSSNPRWKHWTQLALTTVVLSIALWAVSEEPWIWAKGLLLFFPLATGFEIFFRLRARAALPCPHCGFDPYLAIQGESQAKVVIENFWKQKFEEKGLEYPPPPLDDTIGHGSLRKKQPPASVDDSFS